MSVNVDARGLACPQPVIATKRALDSLDAGTVTTIVDNAVAKENVMKFARASHCDVSVSENGGLYTLVITKGDGGLDAPAAAAKAGSQVFLITRDTLGHGSEELGAVLMKSFFFTMTELEPLPRAVLFLNGGVRLTLQGSPVLEHIRNLEGRGVEIISCGTCLDYFGLKDELAAGTIGNMYTIMELLTADKAITL